MLFYGFHSALGRNYYHDLFGVKLYDILFTILLEVHHADSNLLLFFLRKSTHQYSRHTCENSKSNINSLRHEHYIRKKHMLTTQFSGCEEKIMPLKLYLCAICLFCFPTFYIKKEKIIIANEW